MLFPPMPNTASTITVFFGIALSVLIFLRVSISQALVFNIDLDLLGNASNTFTSYPSFIRKFAACKPSAPLFPGPMRKTNWFVGKFLANQFADDLAANNISSMGLLPLAKKVFSAAKICCTLKSLFT